MAKKKIKDSINKDTHYTSSLKFTIDKLSDINEDIIVEGFATKEGVNRKGNNIPVSAYSWDGAFKFFKNTVLAFHRNDVPPVGKIEAHQVVKDGLRVKVRFFKDNASLFMRSLREGVLDAFSIGYEVLKSHEEDDATIFDKIQLHELSVVAIGANSEALFAITDSLTNNKPNNYITFGDSKMPKQLDTQLGDIQPKLDELSSKIDALQENDTAREKLFKQLQDKLQERDKGKITDAELKVFTDKIAPDIKRLSDEINLAKSAMTVQSERFNVTTTDINSMLRSMKGDIDGKAELIFQAPVNYKAMGVAGEHLFNLRNIHDAVYMWLGTCRNDKALLRQLYSSDLYKVFVEETRKFSPEIADAMAISNTGYGAEWAPNLISSEAIEFARVMSPWQNRLRQFSKIDKLPFINGRVTAYLAGEATTDNPDRATASSLKTGATTVDYNEIKAYVPFSEVFNEDSVIPFMELLRSELAMSLMEARSRGFINGDTAGGAATFDTGRSYAASAVEGGFDGLRKYVFSTNTSNVTVDAATDGTIALVDIRDAAAKLGKKSTNSSDLFILAPIQMKNDLLGVFDNFAQYGGMPGSTVLTGQVPAIYGMDVFFDGEYPTDLNATGLYDGTTTTRESITIVHARSWGIFDKRAITLEFDKDITTGQWRFVATGRWAFHRISADDSTTGTYSAAGVYAA